MLKQYRLLLVFCIHILSVIILHLINEYFNTNLIDSNLKNSYKDNYWGLLILAVIVAPLMEETAYRYPLKKGKFVYISLIWGIVFTYITDVHKYIIILILGLNIISFFVYFFFKRNKQNIICIILYIFLFGIIHSANYDIDKLYKLSFFSVMLLFLPQFLLGAILSYIRLNFKFIYTIIYHSMYNLVFVLLLVISKQF